MVVGDGNERGRLGASPALRDLPRLQSPAVVIQRVMNLVMPIKRTPPDGTEVSPKMKAELVIALAAERDAVTTAMDNIGTVHFARFNIIGNDLHLISVYDGTVQGYVHDFAVHLGPAFDTILGFIEDWPPDRYKRADGAQVSVRDHPAEFVEWVLRHDIRQLPRDPSELLRPMLEVGGDGGPTVTEMLFESLVTLFEREPNVHLSMHRAYAGRTVAQIRDALEMGW